MASGSGNSGWGQLNRAADMLRSGDLAGSAGLLRTVLDASPDHPDALHLFGLVALKLGKPQQAVRMIERAIELRPGDSSFHSNCGDACRVLGDLERALGHLRAALILNPGNADAWCNLGSVLRASGQWNEGIEAYRKALALDPSHADAHYNLGLALLVTGQFEEGWKEYQYRWETVQRPLARSGGPPIWRGEDLRNCSIHIYHEQGIGDTIQFARYLPLLRQAGTRLVFECPVELHRLFACLEEIQLLPMGAPAPPCDLQSPLLTLASVLGTNLTNIPNQVPYLVPPEDLARSWKTRVGSEESALRVGLCWAGNPHHVNDRNRSCRPAQLSSLAAVKRTVFYSLQKGEWARQAPYIPPGLRLVDWTSGFEDFADTAALVSSLDLVISVDTAVAHLAGALGVPVWILIPFDPDWRWLLGRQDSPWYPTAQLFRQSTRGEWRSVISAVARSLEGFTARRP